MPRGPEAKIEAYLRRRVEALGGHCWKWVSPARAGVPDRLVIHRGRIIPVELKAPGGRLSPLQRVRHAELAAAGVTVRVLWSRADVDAFVAELELDDA